MTKFIPWAATVLGSAAFLAQQAGDVAVPYGEWTALGCVCFILVWIVTKTIPGMNKDHREEREHAQNEFSANLNQIVTRHESREQARDDVVKEVAAAVRDLASGCAMVKQVYGHEEK